MEAPSLSEKTCSDANDLLVSLEQGQMYPLTSRDTCRYDKATKRLIGSISTVMPPNYFKGSRESDSRLPRYLPADWSQSVHPEGQPYFVRETSQRVVSDNDMYELQVAAKILYWTQRIESKVVELGMSWSSEWELYLKVQENYCFYYFVDRRSRTQFWLESVDLSEFDIIPAVSHAHLDLILEALYWTHVEYFPMHFGGLDKQTVEQLICVLSHGAVDQMTSEGSTFPYPKDDCRKYIEILSRSRDYSNDGYQTCLVARINAEICSTRYNICYGEPQSRLTRDKLVPGDEPQESRCMSLVLSTLTCGMANRHAEQLNILYIDEIVYTQRWREFLSARLQTWKEAFIFASLSAPLHLFLLFTPQTSSTLLTIISMMLFMSSLLASATLVLRYGPMEKSGAGKVANHLASIRSDRNHFLFVGLIYALPSLCHLWGLCVLSINCVSSIISLFGLIPTIVSLCFVAVAVMFIVVLVPVPFSSFRRRQKMEKEDDLV